MFSVFELLRRLFTKEEEIHSKDLARERLRLVLIHDRADVSPQVFESLKSDLIEVISKYMDIDEAGTSVQLDSSRDSVALVASIPVICVKRTAGER